MRKTKENSAHPARGGNSQIRETQATANEERYEAVGGETSTEGVGRGYDPEGADASGMEKSESSADGPLSGELSDPPTKKRLARGNGKDRKHGIRPPDGRSNHAAANSSKSI